MRKIEILAPVRSFENLKIAISCGANAVYFGVEKFNARAKAENVKLSELNEFVEIAHLHGVKTYLTLNTLIKNGEFEDVLTVVDRAIEAKVDAFIVQDIGLASFLLQNYKNIVLHASTQMGIHNLAGAKFLEKLGFKRIVLSRETKLDDIIDIRKNTNLEIEYFVQGALCVAFSGNCYFSSLCCNSSGNRGECLQPCRMMYKALDNGVVKNKGYLLSPKDLCLIKSLKTLQEAGVDSFKIEGRLRRKSYLAQSVTSYVNAVNNTATIDDEIKKLKKVFSRGEFNFGNYLNGNNDIINPQIANHRGEKIGKVIKISPFKNFYQIEVKTTKKLNPSDGIKIVDNDQEFSMGVGNVNLAKNGNQIIYTTRKPIYGDVFLATDKNYEDSLIPSDKKLELEINLTGSVGQNLVAEINCGETCAELVSEFKLDKAKTSPTTYADFKEIFNRTKETEFVVKKLVIDIDNIFIPKSLINSFKNSCLLTIKNKILENVNKRVNNVIKIGDFDKKYEYSDSMVNIDGDYVCVHKEIKNVKNNIIYSPENYNYVQIDQFIKNSDVKFFYLNLPIVVTKDEVNVIDNILSKIGKDKVGVVANNYWGLKYISDGFNVIAGTGLNIVNNISAKFYMNLGAKIFIKSIETNLSIDVNGGLNYEGYPAIMTLCHCPVQVSLGGGCKDCKYSTHLTYKLNDGKEFKIRRYRIINCYFELISNKKIVSKSNKVVDNWQV